MTNFINRANKQCLVYWAFSARDGYGGATFSTPVEIWGRWEDKQKMFTNSFGNQLISSSVVYLNQDVSENDWLFLGGLADIASTIDNTNPKNVANAQQIRAITKVPTLRANKFQRIAFLSDATSTR
jgi:hypothetical protein